MFHSYLTRLLGCCILCSNTFAFAALTCDSSYGIQSTVNGVAGNTYCYANAGDFIDLVKDLKKSNPSYTQTAAAEVVGRFNDVNVSMAYEANSTVLSFSAPEIGVDYQTFSGSTRKESQDQFVDWLKKSGVIGTIMNYQAKTSAASPITGVGGLLPTIASTDFTLGTQPDNAAAATDTSSTSALNNTSINTDNVFAINPSFGSFSVDGSKDKVRITTLPISYTVKLDKLPNHQLIFSAPISMYRVGNAKGYHAGMGIAYRFPVTERWSLMPSARYSLTGSADRATLASVSNAALTSHYTMPVGQFELSFGNMIGYYRTGKFKAGDYSFNPNIHQTILRNGIMLSQPIHIKGHKMAIEYSMIDTHYVGGRKPFMGNMQEYGITLGMHRDAPKTKFSHLRAGATFTRAKSAHGLTVNMGYWF